MFGKYRFNLNTKLTLVTTLLIAATVLISAFVTLYFGHQIGIDSIQKRLATSRSIQQEFTQQQARQLELISLLVASDPAFVAYIAQATYALEDSNSTADLASISDLLLERKRQFGFDIALVTTVDGQQIARSDQTMSVMRDLSGVDLLANAMEQLIPINGFWRERNKLYQAAIVPLARGQNLIGFLVTGILVDNVVASNIGRLGGTEVMIANHEKDSFEAVASSMNLVETQEFITQLNMQGIVAARLTPGFQMDVLVDKLNLAIDINLLAEFEGQNDVFMITTVSIDQTLAPFLSTRSILLGVGVLMILLALVSAIFLVRRVLSPLAMISQATRRVAEGNFETKFPEAVGDDLSELSTSIRRLVNDIRGKDSLAKQMVEVSKKLLETDVHDYQRAETGHSFTRGDMIGSRFEILETIGTGGMGVVFKAIDHDLDEIVALKMLKNQGSKDSGIGIFKEELRLARRISNPNVVRIHDFRQIGENVFISMEYVKGFTIQQILGHAKKMRPFAAKHATMQICKGLAAVHDAGIVHRDLKPGNLILDLDLSVKLMDFGIAIVGDTVTKQKSHDLVHGTAAYLSPEQSQGKGADERSDIYALGILIMEMFVGRRPFQADNDEQLLLKNWTDPPTPVSEYWADAPKSLERLVSKCLEKRPSDRYQSVQALMADLDQVHLS